MIRKRKKDPDFEFSKGKIFVFGDSNPDNVDDSWVKFAAEINAYRESGDPLQVDFRLETFNSATDRYIFAKCRDLDVMAYKQDIKINWHYPDDDEDVEYHGEVYQKFCRKIKIQLIPYTIL
jgi:hypothetical protein